ncbi:MAG: S9 family peptidase [Pseudomonadota bacterium]
MINLSLKAATALVCKILLISLIGSKAVQSEPLPLEAFVQHGDYLDLKLSPDGKHLAGRMRKDETVMLFVLKIDNMELVGGVKPPSNTIIHTLTWANNERIVFEFAQRYSQLDTPIATGELFVTNLDGTDTKLIYGYRAGDEETGRRLHTRKDTRASHEIISLLEEDRKNILIAEYPWATKSIPVISKLNIYTGRKKKVERVPFHRADILADKQGNVRFISWYDKDNKFHAASRESEKADWQEIPLMEGTESVGKPVQINTTADKVYFETDLGKEKLSSLVELDLKSGSTKTLFQHAKVDLSFWESDLQSNEPVVGVFYPDAAHYQYTEASSTIKSSHKLLVKAFAGQDVFITSSTNSGDQLLVRVSSDINPGEYYLFNTATRKADFLWANLSWIDPRQMQRMQHLDVPSRDGLSIPSLLTLPGTDNPSPPLIVLPHGGPHGVRDHWQFDQEVQLLASRGYAVLQVNFRGSGGYGTTFMEQGYREWGGIMINDIVDSTQWLIEQEKVDPERICIYGASYGGYAAMMAAIRAPSLYKCVIGNVGVYDLTLMYSNGDIPRFWGGEAYLEKVLGRNEQQLIANSPVHLVDKLSSKVMLIHGVEDRRVPIIHAMRMRKALEKANRDVVWLSFDGAGHGVWNVEKRKKMYNSIFEFIEQSI